MHQTPVGTMTQTPWLAPGAKGPAVEAVQERAAEELARRLMRLVISSALLRACLLLGENSYVI